MWSLCVLWLSLARFFKFDSMLACWKMNIPIFALFSHDTLQTRGNSLQEGLPARQGLAWSGSCHSWGKDPSDPMSCSPQ